MPGNAPPLTDEQDLLLAYLAQQREGLRHAAYGLTDEQARLAPSVSALSVAGLLKHVAATETYWIELALGPLSPGDESGEDEPSGDPAAQASAYFDTFRVEPDETLADLLDAYAAVARRTEEAVRAADDLTRSVPVPKDMPWFPPDGSWSLRWILLHVIEETARHAGHADIVRESIDGAKMYELMAAAEGWPETDWLKPWKPATAR